MNKEELRQLISSTMQTDGISITVPMKTWNEIAVYIDKLERGITQRDAMLHDAKELLSQLVITF